MATIDQIMRAVTRFADNEVLPRLPTGKGIGAGIMLALVMEGGRDKLLALREHPVVQMMGVMDESGNVDVEKLYSVVERSAPIRILSAPIMATSPAMKWQNRYRRAHRHSPAVGMWPLPW